MRNLLKFTTLTLSTLLLISQPINVYAAEPDYTTDKVSIYFHDNADKLTDSEERSIIDVIKSTSKELDINLNILVLTDDDTDGKDSQTYSDDYMDELFPYTEDNICYFIDYYNDEMYINTMGICTDRLGDKDIDAILDKAYKYFADYKDAKCIETMAKLSIQDLVDHGKGLISVDNTKDYSYDDEYYIGKYDKSIAESLLDIRAILGGLFVGGITLIISLITHNKNNQIPSSTKYAQNMYFYNNQAIYMRTYETKVRRSSSSSSSGGRSHSSGSSHRSSSGRSHGGGGRRR